MKKWYASKTFWFNAFAFVVAVLSAFGYTGELGGDLGLFVLPVVALINIALRFITNKGISI